MAYTSDRTGAEVDTTLDNADTHIATVTGNPHSVTATDLSLGNVDNTADADKPVSTAQQTALDLKADAADVSNVDNTADADKPTSTAQQTSIDNAKAQAIAEARDEVIMVAVSDETSDLAVGDNQLLFRMPFGLVLDEIRASVGTAPTGSTIVIDVEVDSTESSGGSILSTLLTIDATEKTSTTAVTPAVISNNYLPDDSEVAINIDQVGSTVAGAGLKITFKGSRI